MKKFLLMLSGLLLTLPAAGQLFEYTYEGQSIYYDAIEYGKTAKTMEGNSEYSFNYVYGDLILPAHPVNEKENIEYLLTEIGKYSFISSGLNSLELPNSLETIREYAFSKCSSLKTIQFGTSVREIEPFAFAFCDDLAYLEFPNSVKTIGSSAFTDCTWIRSIEMPRNVEKIGSSAFANCPYIDEIYYNTSSPISMPEDVFDKSIYNRVILHIPVGCKENFQAVAPWNLFAEVVDDMTENGLVGEFNYSYNGTTVTYKIIDEDAKTVMTKPGTMAKGGNNVSGDIELPAHPKNGEVEYTLVEIGDRSFAGCSDMTSVKLPNTLKTIGEWAFHNCVKLAAMDIPNSVETVSDCAFYLCRKMAFINIPTSVTYLGQSALCGCDALTSVTLPPSITSISESLFYGCDGLLEMEIPTSITSIGSGAFILCSGLTSMVIPASVTSFGSSIFSGCSNLQTVTLPNTIKVIGDRFFNNCRKLEAIEIPTSVEEIGGSAFSGCSMLTTIELPSSVKVVESYAISYNDNLTSLVLSPSLESIFTYAFACNEAIEDIYYNTTSPVGADENIFESSIYSSATLHVPNGAKETFTSVTPWNLFNNIVDDLNPSGDVTEFEYTYEGQTITYTVIDAEAKTVRTKAGVDSTPGNTVTGDLILPSNPMYGDAEYTLIEIGDRSFTFTGLTSVVIPNTVTTISSAAFDACVKLTSAIIGNSVETIGDNAFNTCRSLASIEIPNSVKKIEDWAFKSCRGLTSVTLGNSVLYIGDYAFMVCSSLSTIDIPASVEYIGERSLSRCDALTAINVSVSNPVYASLEGILYNKSMTELICAPGAIEKAVIPGTVTTIGGSAFYSCSKLNTVDIPSTVTRIERAAFLTCSSLISIAIPSAVEYIGDEAFAYCKSLKDLFYNTFAPVGVSENIFDSSIYSSATLHIPIGAKETFQSVTPWNLFNNIVDDLAPVGEVTEFEYTYEGQTITYTVIDAEAMTVRTKAGVQWAVDNPVTGDLILPSNPMYGDIEYTLLEIGDFSFAWNKITSVVIPGTVQTIASDAFRSCISLTSVVIPNSVIAIDEGAFSYCFSLTSVTLGNSLQSIGAKAFAECSELSVIDIPAAVELIGEKAFMRCFELTAINVSESNPVYTSLDGIVYNKSVTELLLAPGAVEEVIIPETVTTIGADAFYVCRKISTINLPNTVTRIEKEAFMGSSLTSVEIPSAVEFIGDEAFAGCLWLKSVYYNTVDPIEADITAFATVYDKATLYVPEAAIAKCKAIDPWKNFEMIEAYDFNGVEDVVTGNNGVINFTAPYEVYNLSGLLVGDDIDNLVSGIYIVHQGIKVQKIAVK